MVSAKTEPPTLFTTRLAPLPPVAFMTASAKSPERVRIPASSPSALSLSSFCADPEVPITFASSGLALPARLDAVPDDQLAAVQACGAHAHEQLSRPGVGHRRLAQLESGFPRFGADPIRFHFIASLAAPVSRRMCMPVLARSTA